MIMHSTTALISQLFDATSLPHLSPKYQNSIINFAMERAKVYRIESPPSRASRITEQVCFIAASTLSHFYTSSNSLQEVDMLS
jgi:hypothetical protein